MTIDDLLAARGWPEVSLIKIDVQGAEGRVLAGAAETLRRFHPALFLEIDDHQLRRYGSSADALLRSIAALGYTIHSREGKDLSDPLSIETALALGRPRRTKTWCCSPPASSRKPPRSNRQAPERPFAGARGAGRRGTNPSPIGPGLDRAGSCQWKTWSFL